MKYAVIALHKIDDSYFFLINQREAPTGWMGLFPSIQL
jgi:hypothetical protein